MSDSDSELEVVVRRFAREKLGPYREAFDAFPAKPPPFELHGRFAELGLFERAAVPDLEQAVRVVWALSETCAGAGAVVAWELATRRMAERLGGPDVSVPAHGLPGLDGGGAQGVACDVRLEGGRLHGQVRAVPLAARASCIGTVCERDGELWMAWVNCDAGVRVGEPVAQLGVRALCVADVLFDGAGVIAQHKLEGGELAIDFAEYALLSTAAACATASSALREARAYADERYQGGGMIARYDAVRLLLGPNEGAMDNARPALLALAHATPAKVLRGVRSLTKAAVQAASDGLQTFGGYGYMRDFPVEKRFRDAVQLSLMPADRTRLALLAETL